MTYSYPFLKKKKKKKLIPDRELIWMDERNNILISVNIVVLVLYNPHIFLRDF